MSGQLKIYMFLERLNMQNSQFHSYIVRFLDIGKIKTWFITTMVDDVITQYLIGYKYIRTSIRRRQIGSVSKTTHAPILDIKIII